ncbi:hypothetical protein N9D66_00810 [Candidatus Nanopelagicales bacterium]|nr:hypothetical protein [Candidatus Nanopelagicales bacterium]
MTIATIIVVIAIWISLVAANPIGDMDLTISGITAVSVQVTLLGLLFGAVAFTVGSITGARRLAVAIASALAAVAFVIATFLPMAENLADLAKLSPWYYYSSANPLANGIDLTHLLVLLAATTIITIPGWIVFTRRNLH